MTNISAKALNEEVNIGIVVSRFNEEVTKALLEGAVARLQERKIPAANITIVHVPGAVEIPIAAQRLVVTGAYAAVIALSAVIRGETSHYDYVCEQISNGCQQVALTMGVPVIFGVLTTDTEEQALARAGGSGGHKGREAADAALEMISVLAQIDERHAGDMQTSDLMSGLIAR